MYMISFIYIYQQAVKKKKKKKRGNLGILFLIKVKEVLFQVGKGKRGKYT